jgi:hypothetical protein
LRVCEIFKIMDSFCIKIVLLVLISNTITGKSTKISKNSKKRKIQNMFQFFN